MQKAILTFTDLPAGTCDVTLSFDPPVMGSSKTTPAISLALFPALKAMPFQGIKHHALHDARHEARQVIEGLRLLRP